MKLLRLFVLSLAASLGLYSPTFGDMAQAQTPRTISPTHLAPDLSSASGASTEIIVIPGPLRSFLRMAGISQKAEPEEVIPLLAEMVNTKGYARGVPTEFLVLLKRYMQQAAELTNLAAPAGVIRVANCQDAGPLLAVLGYKLRNGCGPNTAVQTADPDRAFLTIDSGFPLAELEEAIRGSKLFSLPFPSARVPVLFAPKDWSTVSGTQNLGLIDSLLQHPDLARLFSAVSHMDSETRIALHNSPGLARLVRYAPVLDFYGSHLSIRSGRVAVPGGPAAEPAWKDLVGAGPDSPGEFVSRLAAKDAGWLAAYFDALSSVSQAQQAYFTQPTRLKRFYDALRSPDPLPGATRGVFRPDPDLALLVTRLQVEPNGQPHIPGNLELWKDVFQHGADSKRSRRWASRARHWTEPDQLIEALISLSREPIHEDSLQAYLTLCDIDRPRAPEERLTPETVRKMADKFTRFGDQYPIFAEFSSLNNNAITNYLSVADALDHITLPALRSNAIGIFQANIGLWQILARQGEIPRENWSDSWNRIVSPFSKISSPHQLFDVGRTALRDLWQAASTRSDLTQDEAIALLAGPPQTTVEGREMRSELARRIQSVMNAQRLVSLDTLFALGEGLTEMSQGKGNADALLALAAELREFELPRPIFSATEKTEFQYGRSDIRHTTLQTRTNLTSLIKSGSAQELGTARGRLAAFLRDTLVGLNYAYYDPPGGQMLLNNALFVRSHDYTERLAMEGTQPWKSPELINLGVTAGGGTHLAGSLADLPYSLAVVEQDFIIPEHVQSLIWQDLVPSLLTSAVVARWWGVSRNELHAATLYQRAGEALLAAAAGSDELRERIIGVLANRMSPQRLEQVEKAILSGQPGIITNEVMPAETFSLAADFLRKFPGEADRMGAAGQELQSLSQQHPDEVNSERLSRDFGVSHPALAHNYGRELMNCMFFPTFRDYSSRLLGESWESNNLYWARLADEMGYAPVLLNRLVPELTRRMVEKLSATTLDDWPAISRAMRDTGEEFRLGKTASLDKTRADSRP